MPEQHLGEFEATAYGPPWDAEIIGVTKDGTDLRAEPRQYVVAVDPRVIGLGTSLRIAPNPFGDDQIVFRAADIGSAIKGNKIDFYDWRGRESQLRWGRRPVQVTRI